MLIQCSQKNILLYWQSFVFLVQKLKFIYFQKKTVLLQERQQLWEMPCWLPTRTDTVSYWIINILKLNLFFVCFGDHVHLEGPHWPVHSYGRTSRVWDSLLVMKPGCAVGRGFAPRPGQFSKESFSSNQETGKVFSPEMPFYCEL